MQILVLNAGSSSIKFQLFEMDNEAVLAKGAVENIGGEQGQFHLRWQCSQLTPCQLDHAHPCPDHREALALIVDQLGSQRILSSTDQLAAIAHRVVHGGESFHAPAPVDDAVLQAIRDNIPLAPLHNPANLEGIEVARSLAPQVPQIAVFDTAFHQTLPEVAYRYALPESLYREHRVRRYGFHGTSHHYVAKQAARVLDRPLASLNLITLHLGNGSSAAAIQQGRCIDTSMGMTPLEGLVMGTRSGDLDPSLSFYLQREAGLSSEAVETLFNKESGLKGICGISDMRRIEEEAKRGNQSARLAEAMFVYRIRKYIGAYLAILGGLDAVVFTGGIGENSPRLRQMVCEGLMHLGIEIDIEANQAGSTAFQAAGARVAVLRIGTDEELEIARSAKMLIGL